MSSTRYISVALLFVVVLFSSCKESCRYAVVVSANAEWASLKKVYPAEKILRSPWGEYFTRKTAGMDVLFFHEGWGKVSAAGATQYVIDRFNPDILINIGTCGGFEGGVERFETILADKTVIYDIIEAMGDSKEAIADYTTKIDLSWLGENYPVKVKKTLLVSADRDLRQDELALLKKEYSAVAGDWETGAIAYVAVKNRKKILILRGVTDIVSTEKAEAYGNIDLFAQRTDSVMSKLLGELPLWIGFIEKK